MTVCAPPPGPKKMDMRIRAWRDLRYLDAEKILRGLRDIATSGALASLPYEVAALRTRQLRKFHEGRQAALFCYGMGQFLGKPVTFALSEASDYDVVAKFGDETTVNFVPVQLKELVPDRVNAAADLQAELDKIGKYVDSRDLVVAFHLNTTKRIEFADLRLPFGVVKELWFFGALGSDQRRWVLLGDMLSEAPSGQEFEYPA